VGLCVFYDVNVAEQVVQIVAIGVKDAHHIHAWWRGDDETELERLAVASSRRLQAILREAREQVRTGKTMQHDAVWEAIAKEPSPTIQQPRVPHLEQ
jgi:hypothetical protein